MKNLFIAFCIVSLFASCFSFTQFQTGKTSGKGEADFGATLNGAAIGSSGTFGSLPLSIPEFQGNVGLSDKFDLTFKYNFPAGLYVGGKYNIFGNEVDSKASLAVGANIGGLVFSAKGVSDSKLNTAGFYIFSLPLHFSFQPSPIFTIGISPNYTKLGFFGNSEEIGGNLIGIAPHFEVGKRIKFIVGGNLLFSVDGTGGTFTSYGLGIKF
ncbi:MAG TPA: hypothetical protein PK006_00335 [Saprospiraceae bacterium]|nr:hypothetical protein [Saprospiraceae bacterium]